MPRATILGFPRIGVKRELKTAIESYWLGRSTASQLLETARGLRQRHWVQERDAGLDQVPCNDFSLYDQVLDAACLVGAVPPRFEATSGDVDLDTYFAMARGIQRPGIDARPMEMTKWFDTNYHYIVPEFWKGMPIRLASSKPFDELAEAQALGVDARPVLLGPWSLLRLGKSQDPGFHPLRDLLDPVLEVYGQVLERLAKAGAGWIQLDEPCLVQDTTEDEIAVLRRVYETLASAKGGSKLLLATYFGTTADHYPTLVQLPVDGLGLDFVRGPDQVELVKKNGLGENQELFAGVVDGRNIWINDLDHSLEVLRGLGSRVGTDRVHVSSSCSLLHVPYDSKGETDLDPELQSWLAFAAQKLDEIVGLARGVSKDPSGALWEGHRAALESRRRSPRTRDPEVRSRLAKLGPDTAGRQNPFAKRQPLQRDRLGLPAFRTTTVGSFPQTSEVRSQRRRFGKGAITQQGYEQFLQEEIQRVVELQEDIGLDVLVHGEFERNDMVQYFAELLDGFAFTQNGWVQSYGTRCVRPPIVYADVRRSQPMTVRWTSYAQTLTKKPVKGMLTGPVTILQWSFVRDDQPRQDTCRQIALAIRDEVADLDAAGTPIIQIDEPAIREGLPLRRSEWAQYLEWAVSCFRLASGSAADHTQVQTHMCYSEFGDMLDAISGMDADVILIENSRSNLELLQTFRDFKYDKEIGPGVYDIHSPRVPPVEEMVAGLRLAAEVLQPDSLWVTPDCGLKTRSYEEAVPALRNMVEAARRLRNSS